MSSWSEILLEINSQKEPIAYLENKIINLQKQISDYRGRNVISYYSAWLSKASCQNMDINDSDKNAFMQAVYKLDKKKGLDLFLHTPGGDIAATESIVDYLKLIFKDDVSAIIPQQSMSAGTMIALSCKSILMGNQSSLGPIDPQYKGISCQEALDEFEQAKSEVTNNPQLLGLWQTRISKYTPTFLIACKNAIDWSESLATDWIGQNPFIDPSKRVGIINTFVRHSETKSHNRHISITKCKEVGLNIEELESDPKLQDLVLTLHHCYMILFTKTNIVKAVCNQLGARYYITL